MVPVRLITGRLPKNGSEALIPSHLLSDINLDCAVGDTLDLAAGLRQDGDDILSQHVPYRSGDELLSVGEDKSYNGLTAILVHSTGGLTSFRLSSHQACISKSPELYYD